MSEFSFDIVSGYDKAEMNNVYTAAQRDMANRYDFKNTPAQLEWLNNKAGFKIIGGNKWQCDAIVDIVRKKLAARGQSAKVLDTSLQPVEANLKTTWELPFKQGLGSEHTKHISKLLRDEGFKIKTHVQGDAVRVASSSKDELQKVMSFLKNQDFDVPLQYTNYR